MFTKIYGCRKIVKIYFLKKKKKLEFLNYSQVILEAQIFARIPKLISDEPVQYVNEWLLTNGNTVSILRLVY